MSLQVGEERLAWGLVAGDGEFLRPRDLERNTWVRTRNWLRPLSSLGLALWATPTLEVVDDHVDWLTPIVVVVGGVINTSLTTGLPLCHSVVWRSK